MSATAVAPADVLAPEHERESIKKVSIIISKGSLEGIYPGLILANGARMEGIEADVFFTFFGMDAITKSKIDKVKVATVGNPALGVPALLGIIPGMAAFVTRQMAKKMEQLDIPPIPEFIQLIADSGAKLYAYARINSDALHRAAAVLRCLGHPLRLRLLEALESGEQTVSELQEYTGATQPMVSQHLMVLKAHGVVDLRRAGPFAYYWIVEPKVKSVLDCIRAGECGDAGAPAPPNDRIAS